MRKLVTIVFSSLCLIACLNAESVQIVIEGKNKATVKAIEHKGILYLDTKKAAKIFKGSLYWQSKSGKVVLGVKRFRGVFKIGSKFYSLNGQRKSLSGEVLRQNKKVFLPLGFFESDEFSGAIGKNIYYDDLSNRLEISKKYNVGEIDYFSFGNLTRLSFELKGVERYSYRKKTSRGVQILIPNSIPKKSGRENFEKGMIKSASVRQFGKDVLILASFSRHTKSWDVSVEGASLIITASGSILGRTTVKEAMQSDKSETDFDAEQDLVLTQSDEKGEIILDFSGQEQSLPQEPPVSTFLAAGRPNIPDDSKSSKSGKKVIVIDPGHGGVDSGCVSKGGVTEKEVNLSIAKILAGYLKRHKVVKVILTRSKDVFVALSKRSECANGSKADMFVSVHANSHRDSKQNGFEVFVMSENASDPWAREVAKLENSVRQYEDDKFVTSADILLHSLAKNEYINDSLLLAGIITKNVISCVPLKNRRVKKADFYVLRGTYAPSVLIETGFITNKRDRRILLGSSYRKKIANAIYKAILDYARRKGWKL